MAAFLGTGPYFISGTSHRLLQLGQQPSDSPPPVPPPLQIPPAALPASEPSPTASAGKKRKVRQSSEEPSDVYLPSPAGPTTSNRSKGTGGTTLYEMIEAGVLQPGIDNATVTYKGTTYSASLQSNGTIFFRGMEFNTPSAFSVYVKRLITPNKQGDDGWHSVSINGVMLHHLRTQYLQQRQQQQEQYIQSGGVLPPLPVLKRANSSKATSKQKFQRGPSPRPQQQPWHQQSPVQPQQYQQQRPPSPVLQHQQQQPAQMHQQQQQISAPQQQQQQPTQPKPAGMQYKLHIKPPRPSQASPQQQATLQPVQQQEQQQQVLQPAEVQQQMEDVQPAGVQAATADVLQPGAASQQQHQLQQQQQLEQPVQEEQQQQQQQPQELQQQQHDQEQQPALQQAQPAPSLAPEQQQQQPQQQPQQPTGPPPLKKLKLGKVHLPSPRAAPTPGAGSTPAAAAAASNAAGHAAAAAANEPPAAPVHKPVIKLAMKPSSAALAVAAAFAGTKPRGSSSAAGFTGGAGVSKPSGGVKTSVGAGWKAAVAGLGGPRSASTGPKSKVPRFKGSAAGYRVGVAAAGMKGTAAAGAEAKGGPKGAVNGKAKRAASAGGGAPKGGKAAAESKSAAASSQSGQQQQQQQRVQCSRCEMWRSVPGSEWPKLQAEQQDQWFCEDATWELTDFEPFTPGCLSDMWAEGEV